jgi:methyltransferase (TIGR00027 family)
MRAGQNSRTAQAAAAFRASHHLYAQPRVFEDRFALVLTSRGWRAVLSNRVTHWLVLGRALSSLKPVLAQVLVRSRFAEDALAKALANGIQQYVIVGAGLDSYALRHPDSTGRVRVFEVDHPDTQRAKRQRLQALALGLPANLEYVGVDFEKQALGAALGASSYRSDAPAFFSWLGTTHYLSPQATLGTLRSIAQSAAPASEVVLDYSVPPELIDSEGLHEALWLKKLTNRLGEPLIGGLNPAQLHADVKALGYDIIEDIAAPEQTRRYFANRADGLAPTSVCRLLHLRSGLLVPSAC